MGSSNLPDDVTHADIDEHFGEPETSIVRGTVMVAVEVETQFSSERERKKELESAFHDGAGEVVHVTIDEVV